MFSSVYGPWTLFTDLGFIFLLILIGKYLRVKVKLIQQLFIPPSLLAGFLGLILGPNGFDIIPFSDQLGTYAGVLIALVFASLPLSSPKIRIKETVKKVGPIWAFSQLGMLLQWSLMGLFGVLVLSMIWPHLNEAFGILLPTGYYGGHGTAAAVGDSLANLGWDEGTSIGMTVATVGIVISIVGGLAVVKMGARKGKTTFIKDFSDLPDELRTGLTPQEKRDNAGMSTTSSISIDSLAFHMAFIFVIALGGYLASRGVKYYFPKFEMPIFSAAFVVGLCLKLFLDKVNVSEYISTKQVERLSGTFTDLLVAFGVASIQLGVVVKYALPLVMILVAGAIIVVFSVFYIGKRLLRTYEFERKAYAWSWWFGTMAMGIAILKIIDPKMESKVIDDYAMTYLPIAPVEIAVITFAPVAFMSGNGVWFSLILLACVLLIFIFAKKMGWWKKREVAVEK